MFDATHDQIRRWVRDDGIDGLRVDHPDGLADPVGYMAALREMAARSRGSRREDPRTGRGAAGRLALDGTTGYDALTEVQSLFVDPSAEAAFDRLYRDLTGDQRTFHEHVEAGKRTAVTTILQAEVSRLARLVPGVENAAEALGELAVHFPVYRSYLPEGAHLLAVAIEGAPAPARPRPRRRDRRTRSTAVRFQSSRRGHTRDPLGPYR